MNERTYDKDQLRLELIRDEGKKLTPYKDSLGFWTVGIGHLLQGKELNRYVDLSKNIPIKSISNDECNKIFEEDVIDAEINLDKILPIWRELDDTRQRALINLSFNLGGKLAKFFDFLRHMRDKNYIAAGTALQNSLWWKQVKSRGPRIKAMIQGKPKKSEANDISDCG